MKTSICEMQRTGIRIENVRDEPLRLMRHLNVGREIELAKLDLRVGELDVARLERRRANEQRVQYATNRPHVDLEAVTGRTLLEDFRGDVVGCAAKRSFSLVLRMQSRGQSEVAKF